MIRVMIADDHAIVRQGLKQILSDVDDMTVSVEASNGDEALIAIRGNDWDVLLLDIAMPGKSVLDLIKLAKTDKPNQPILILSAYSEDQFAIRLLRAGADGYLGKESAPEQLVRAIRKVSVGGKFISQELAEVLVNELSHSQPKPPHHLLTDREYIVFIALAKGKRLSDIATELSLSVKTISTHRTRILKKMNLSTNADLIHYSLKYELLPTK